jgi:hypothetical protein
MEKSNLYSAKKAREDYRRKADEKEAFVNEDKILLLLSNIKAQIHKLEIDSKNSNIGYREYTYTGYLSPGEQKVLKDLGYKIKFEDDNGMNGDYYRISW